MPTRNSEVYFSELPKVDIGRSIFNRDFGHKTSFNVGDLIPFYIDEVVPGSTHNITTSVVARLQTLLNPIMDNLYLDTFYFFVPMRILWDHWKEFCGENSDGPWTRDKIQYRIPVLYYPVETSDGAADQGFDQGSIADYFGVPINTHIDTLTYGDENCPSALPFRAYAKIVNEFFRDQNLQQPIVVHTDDTNRRGVHNRYGATAPDDPIWYVTDLELGGKPFKAARFHDYFSSCLPQPQKSEAVSIFGNVGSYSDNNPMATANGIFAPVGTKSTYTIDQTVEGFNSGQPLRGFYSSGSNYSDEVRLTFGTAYNTATQNVQSTTGTVGSSTGFVPNNLWANLNIPEATINNLRLAFQLQKYYEKSARGGTRYREYLAEFFGVNNGDSRMQIPEYLGGHRIPLSIHQVANTGKSEGAALGDLGAMSNTSDTHEDFHMSFSEHGYIIGLCCVRYDNTYSQGLEKFWSRRDILDFYNPVFAHISEQPVYRREISLGLLNEPGGTVTPNGVFGYLPAWQDYRQKPSRVSGEMRPEVSNTLASWHLADDYEYAPFLSEEWIMTDQTNVDRVLAVTSQVSNQIFADFWIQNQVVQPMPVHSIPGLADHF